MAIVVLSPGILTSVQDGGRQGYQQYGVSPSGPMDLHAFRTANILVGNDPDEAGLEMTVMGAELTFTDPAVVAITGADMGATLNGNRTAMYRALPVQAGDILKFGFAMKGCRTYLAVRGGIGVEPVMGSRATMLGKNFGGFKGRKLQKDDRLEIRPCTEALAHPETYFTDEEAVPEGVRTLRVIMGPQEDRFTQQGIHTFLNSEYTVGQDFDRQGYRLEGEKIEHKTDSNIISDGVVTGSIQIPGTGLPIVMTAERATVGGYTKIATVITVDLPLIGQCKAGDRIRFQEVSVETAQELLRQEADRLEALRRQVEDPAHLPPADTPLPQEAAAPAVEHEYEYIRDVTISINGKSYEVTIQKWKQEQQ